MRRWLPYLLLFIAAPVWAQFKGPGQRAQRNLGSAVSAATNAAAAAQSTANTANATANRALTPPSPLPGLIPPSANRLSIARTGGDLDLSRPTLTTATHIKIPNTAPGTALNEWVILSGTPSKGTVALTSTTSGVEGLCSGGCGSTGMALVQNGGFALCVFDGATTAGDYVGLSVSIGGACTDIGSTQPVGILVVGRVYSTNAGAGTFIINMLAPDVVNASGGGVNAPTEAGNDTTYNATTAIVSGVPHTIHAGTGGPTALATAFSRCPGGATPTAPCVVYGDPGQTYTISSTLTVGSPNAQGTGYPQTLELDGASITCTGTTAGTPCISLTDSGNLICHSWSRNGGGKITATAAFSGTAIVASSANIAANNTHMSVQGCTLAPSTNATITKGTLWVGNVSGLAYFAHLSITEANSSTAMLVDGGTGGSGNLIYASGIWITGGGTGAGTRGLAIVGHVADFECDTCGIVDFIGTGIKYVDLEAAGGFIPIGIFMPDMYEEISTVDATTVPLYIGAAFDLNMPAWYIQHGGGFATEPTNCIVINGGTNVTGIHIQGRFQGGVCVTPLNNVDSGRTLTNSGGFDYHYENVNATNNGVTFDAPINGGVNSIATPLTVGANATYVLPTNAITTQKFTFSASATETLPQASYPGQVLNAIVCQNGTGGFTPSFAAIAGLTIVGTFPVFATGANQCGDFSLTYDATNHAYLTGSAPGPL